MNTIKNDYSHYIKYAIYEDEFNIKQLNDEQKELFSKNSFFKQPKLKTLQWLHYLTLGISTFFWYGMQYSKLPKIQDEDFDSIKAIGFMFIPIFSFFWTFIYWDRLIKRLNFQLKLRGKESLKKDLIYLDTDMTTIIPIFGFASLIPIIGIGAALLNYFILMPTLLKQTYLITDLLSKENIENMKSFNLENND